MQITKKIFRISSIFPCLLCIAISFAKEIDKFACNFEDPNSCQWTQDSSDDFNWTRHQSHTKTSYTGPLTDHTKSVGFQANKKQGPGSIRHSASKCIHVFWASSEEDYDSTRPRDGELLIVHGGCGKGWLEFQLWPNGTLMFTRHSMCVKPTGPVTDGVRMGVFSSCDATDTWSWTAQGSLQYKKKMCLKPETGGAYPRDDVKLVLDSICDKRQNFFEFMPTSGWYLYIKASSPRQPNDKVRLISPSTAEVKSCLLFFYHMYGYYGMGELRVYVKSGGKMDPVWSRSGDQGVEWHQAQVAVNNQTASYQFAIEGVRGESIYGDIAIDDISLMDTCPRVSTTPASSPSQTSSQENQPTVTSTSKKVTTTFTVSITPAISPSQTSPEDKGTTDYSSRIIIISTTLGAGVLLSIVLIVLLIKYKHRKRAPKLSFLVNIPLETNEISPEPLPVDEEPCYETVAEIYDDVGTSGKESEDPSADDYIIPINERGESYEDVKVGRNLPDYEELDLSEREADDYQKLMKT